MSVIHANDQNFDEIVLKSDLPVIVDFWAPWCGPCRMLAPIFDSLAEKYNGKIKFVKVNVDENPTSAIRYNIQGIPTLIIFKSGIPLKTLVGLLPPNQLENILNSFIEHKEENEVKGRDDLNNKIENNKDKIIILNFTSSGCETCQDIKNVLNEIKNDNIIVLNISLDNSENYIIALNYDVNTLPHIEILKNGITIHKIVGNHSKDEIINIINNL